MRWRISYDRDPLVLPHGKWDLHAIAVDGRKHYITCFPSRADAQEAVERIISVGRSWRHG